MRAYELIHVLWPDKIANLPPTKATIQSTRLSNKPTGSPQATRHSLLAKTYLARHIHICLRSNSLHLMTRGTTNSPITYLATSIVTIKRGARCCVPEPDATISCSSPRRQQPMLMWRPCNSLDSCRVLTKFQKWLCWLLIPDKQLQERIFEAPFSCLHVWHKIIERNKNHRT